VKNAHADGRELWSQIDRLGIEREEPERPEE
jgi:hypothetical protein